MLVDAAAAPDVVSTPTLAPACIVVALLLPFICVVVVFAPLVEMRRRRAIATAAVISNLLFPFVIVVVVFTVLCYQTGEVLLPNSLVSDIGVIFVTVIVILLALQFGFCGGASVAFVVVLCVLLCPSPILQDFRFSPSVRPNLVVVWFARLAPFFLVFKPGCYDSCSCRFQVYLQVLFVLVSPFRVIFSNLGFRYWRFCDGFIKLQT
mmetsp:Transcript_47364/g.93856  ORF Transcript_47364/g.93856 Transcript_47364/m.93856 type:complete len:207 (-) Transcript_47364:515-1135(-)